jgi:hypothetical protein
MANVVRRMEIRYATRIAQCIQVDAARYSDLALRASLG